MNVDFRYRSIGIDNVDNVDHFPIEIDDFYRLLSITIDSYRFLSIVIDFVNR